jgi:hypothetical protein
MYMSDAKTAQAELKAAEEDFRASVERLIAQHAVLRGKRGELKDRKKAGPGVGNGGHAAKPSAHNAQATARSS